MNGDTFQQQYIRSSSKQNVKRRAGGVTDQCSHEKKTSKKSRSRVKCEQRILLHMTHV
jgi:hypothetical protein